MDFVIPIALMLILYLGWAILYNSFFNQVFSFAALLLLLLVSSILSQPFSFAKYFQILLALLLAGVCLALLPPVQLFIFNSRYPPKPYREDLEVLYPLLPETGPFVADIVAVHGLGSNPDTTWRARKSHLIETSADHTPEAEKPMWLRDFLGQDLAKLDLLVRVMVFNHNTGWQSNAAEKTLDNHGQDLLQDLSEKRQSVGEKRRPIIFLGHSFGGIIIKKALVMAKDSNDKDIKDSIAAQTKGIIFIATPHKGSQLTIFGKIFALFGYFTGSSTHLLEIIQPGSPVNKQLHSNFLNHYQKETNILCAYETVRQSFWGFPVIHVVDEDSAVIDGPPRPIGLSKTHGELQRAFSRKDRNYKTLFYEIKKMVQTITAQNSNKRIDSWNEATMDPIITVPDGPRSTSWGSDSSVSGSRLQQPNSWPSDITEKSLQSLINVFFDRLAPTLPFFSRSFLQNGISSNEHRNNLHFGAMLLSLCAFSLQQPVYMTESSQISSRKTLGKKMLDYATRMRSASNFGENPTLEAVWTSFFLFGCHFGNNQHIAAWLSLRQAVSLASEMNLDKPQFYRLVDPEEKGRRMRTFFVLSITERAYALQHNHTIEFEGQALLHTDSMIEYIDSVTVDQTMDIQIDTSPDSDKVKGLAKLAHLFNAMDEDIISCWNDRCKASIRKCQIFDSRRALDTFRKISEVDELTSLISTQQADTMITQKWLLNRIWCLCISHKLLATQSAEPELRYDYAISIAQSTLDVCKSLTLNSMDVHGVGLVEKLYDIAINAVKVAHFAPNFDRLRFPGDPSSTGSDTSDINDQNTLFNPSQPKSSAIQDMALKYLEWFKKIRAGNHSFLPRYENALQRMNILAASEYT